VRASLSRMTLAPEDADPEDDDSTTNIARLSTLEVEAPQARAQALLALAVEQAVSLLWPRDTGPVATWLIGKDAGTLRRAVEVPLTRHFESSAISVRPSGQGGSAALLAVEQATLALARGEVELALVAAVDIRTDAASLVAALATGRTIGPGRSWGFVPGEGAAALLLTNDRGLRRLGLSSLSTILASASAQEPNPHSGSRPCTGTGLTDAVRRVLGALPSGYQVDQVLCDLNGERERSDEWGFTVPRVSKALADPTAFVVPASVWGDCGVASGLMLTSVATSIIVRASAPTRLLIWTSSDEADRGALLLGSGSPAGTTPPSNSEKTPAPPWAEALDQEVLAEMIEECAFRAGQRDFQLEDAVTGEPPNDWAAIARTEDILGTLADGLAGCDKLGWDKAVAAIDPGTPLTVYAALRVLVVADQRSQTAALIKKLIAVEPTLEPLALRALVHGCCEPMARGWAQALFDAAPELSWLAVDFAGAKRMPLPLSQLDALARRVPAERAPAFARAVGEMGAPEFRILVAPWLMAPDPVLRTESLVADLLLGRTAAREGILRQMTSDPSVLIPAALAADARRAPEVLRQAQASGGADAILAAGLLGHGAAVPWLLSQLDNESLAVPASHALELLLGTRPLFEGPKAADSPDEPAVPLPASRPAWAALAEGLTARHPSSQRLRAGVAATGVATTALLALPHLPPLVRRYLGCEAVLRGGAKHLLDPGALVRDQQAGLVGQAVPMPAGGWDLAPSPRRGAE
jgi:hypothetical protein